MRPRPSVHVVNASGHFGNSFYPPMPMRDVEITVPLTDAPASARLLRADADCPFEASPNGLTLRIPEVNLFEAVYVT